MKKVLNQFQSLTWALLIALACTIPSSALAMAENQTKQEYRKNFATRLKAKFETLQDDWKCLFDPKRTCTWQQKARIATELVALTALVLSGGYLVRQKKEARERAAAEEAARTARTDQLFSAIQERQIIMAQDLIQQGVNIDAQDKHGETPLHLAARLGNVEIVDLLLNEGADKDAQDKNGNTPLHMAGGWGNGEIVDLLFDKGANPRIKNNKGETPFDVAISVEMQVFILNKMEEREKALSAARAE